MDSPKENKLLKQIEKYQKEFENDSEISEFNVREKQMMLPGIKHKFVAYLIQHKRKKYELETTKQKAIEELIKQSTPDIGLSKPVLEKKHESHPTIKKINNLIEEQNIIILYLEKIENISRSMTYDIGNLVKIMQLETT
jgi:hypothetical protein